MRIVQVGYSFEFNYNIIIADKVCTICLFQFVSIIIYLQFLLSFKRDATIRKFNSQGLLIDRFKES